MSKHSSAYGLSNVLSDSPDTRALARVRTIGEMTAHLVAIPCRMASTACQRGLSEVCFDFATIKAARFLVVTRDARLVVVKCC